MQPSKSNRLREYVRITDRDWMVAEYVDYLKFYSNYRTKAKTFFSRDNGKSLNLAWFALQRNERKQFIVDIYRLYYGQTLHVASFAENYVDSQSVLRCDLYGKWLLVMNREDRRDDFETVLQFWGMQEVTITRIDYAVDCIRLNRNKLCTLKSQFSDVKRENGVPYSVTFGKKQTSPQFIRYYDKIKDIKENGFEWLYPEYRQYDQLMRYELQVNSDGIAHSEKQQPIEALRSIANFGHYIPRQKRDHNRLRYESDDYLAGEKLIKKMRKAWNGHDLLKLYHLIADELLSNGLILESPETKQTRETLELKRKDQDERIYWSALDKLNLNLESDISADGY